MRNIYTEFFMYPNLFIKDTNTYLCLLWNNLKSSRMWHWNKILLAYFGAGSSGCDNARF